MKKYLTIDKLYFNDKFKGVMILCNGLVKIPDRDRHCPTPVALHY